MRHKVMGIGFFAAFVFGASAEIRSVPNERLSASFLPPRFHVSDPSVRARLVEWIGKQKQDSTSWAAWEGDDLRLSPDLASRLSGTTDTVGRLHTRVRRALERLNGSGIEEDEGVAAASAYYPDDSLFFYPQWPLNNTGATLNGTTGKVGLDMGMTRVWDRFDGDDSLVVAVLDAGFNFKHPDLQGRWYRNMKEVNGTAGVDDDGNGVVDDTAGWDFVDNDNLPQDYHGHGTMTSGEIVATFDNGKGIAGMIPRARVLPVRVLNAAGSGTLTSIANGIQYAVKMKVSAINFSISGGWATTNTAMRAAFQVARDSGIPIAVATGNDHINLDSNPMTPSSYGFTNIYMVASHTVNGDLSGFSNYGPTTVPLAAPGEHTMTTHIPDNIQVFRDNFDTGTGNWTFATAGNFTGSTTSPLEGTRTLQWVTGNNTWAATTNYIDLTGKLGSTVSFILDYVPASALDQFIVEGQREGSTTWTAFGAVASTVSKQTLVFDMHPMDGYRFKLRFRTALTAGTTTSRVLRIDDVRVYNVDLTTQKQNAYVLTGGTSLAAPFMTGYIGMLRLACKRSNTTFTRALTLAGVTLDSSLIGKVTGGNRLDVAKGLAFYTNTLPSLALTDSTKTSWTIGNQVAYNLSIQRAAAAGYTYKVKTPLANTTLTTAGAFSWSSTGAAAGSDTLRFRAEGSPLVLRKFFVFSLAPVVGLSGEIASRPVLWVGRRAFFLPVSFFQNPNHHLRVENLDANGRAHEIFSGPVQTPVSSKKVGYQIPGLSGVSWRVWLDGEALASTSR